MSKKIADVDGTKPDLPLTRYVSLESAMIALDKIAAIMGSAEDWDADLLDDIGEAIKRASAPGVPHVGSGTEYWTPIAEHYGMV